MHHAPEDHYTINKTIYRREISASVMVLGILALCAFAYVVETVSSIFT